MNRTEIVTAFLLGFNEPSKIQVSLALLADDYSFTNPIVETHTKAEFIELAKKIGEVITGLEVIDIAESPDWVAAFYEFQTELPGLEKTIGSEWFRIADGKIQESRLVYDASHWRKLYAEM